jgi:hypothetical protein
MQQLHAVQPAAHPMPTSLEPSKAEVAAANRAAFDPASAPSAFRDRLTRVLTSGNDVSCGRLSAVPLLLELAADAAKPKQQTSVVIVVRATLEKGHGEARATPAAGAAWRAWARPDAPPDPPSSQLLATSSLNATSAPSPYGLHNMQVLHALLDGGLLASMKAWLEASPPLAPGTALTADSAQRVASLLTLLGQLPIDVAHLQARAAPARLSVTWQLVR